MDLTYAALLFAMLAGFQRPISSLTYNEDVKRHYIYWDPTITEIIKDPSFSLHVEMGHFMDIVCPLTNLGITDDPGPPVLFDLYNVTEDGFKNCNPKGGRLIFACSLPDQENKLTIKFQSISPSPFGFRFQECAEYYFLAVKRPSPLENGRESSEYRCTEDTERLRIKVGCSKKKEEKKLTTTTPLPTTTKKPSKSFLDRLKKELKDIKDTVVPEVNDIAGKKSEEETKGVHSASVSDNNKNGGENSASKTAHCSAFTTLFFALISLIWFSIQNLSS